MSDIFDIYLKDKPNMSLDMIFENPKRQSEFLDWIANSPSINDKQRRIAKLYAFINSYNNVNLFKNGVTNNHLDLEDVGDLVTDNPYAVPNNAVERLFYGNSSKKGLSGYGLMLNNPISNKILSSSNQIETLMRSSTILNDLGHSGYSVDKIMDILELSKKEEAKLYQDLHISMQNAINTMNAANFDYDNISEVMNKASYIIPFPTFYLKNLAFWADQFTKNPQLVDNIISTQEGLWAGKDTKDEFAAEAKGRGAVPIGQQNKHLTGIVKQSPYNSMFGAFNAVNNFKEDFAYRTNPALRPIARHLQDPKDIKYRPYNTNQYQKNITKNDKDFSELAYMYHQLNPYERVTNTYLRTPGKVANNTWQMSDFLPSIFQPDFSKK